MQADFHRPRFERYLLAIAIGLYVIHLVYAIGSFRALYADGVYFLVNMMERRSFMHWGTSRLFGQSLAELPVVIALKLGLTHVRTLLYVHGLSVFGLYPLSLLLCYWGVRDQAWYLLFPLLGLFGGALNAEFDIITDSHRFVCFFWPLFLLMIFRRGVIAAVLIGICAIPTLLTYESMLFFGPLLAAVAFWRSRAAHSRRIRWLWYLLIGWFLAGTMIALQYTLHPDSPSNRMNFLYSLLFFFKPPDVHYPGLLSVAVVAMVALLFLGKLRAWESLSVRMVFGWGGLCLVIALLPLFAPTTLALYLQHEARVLNLYLPFGFALLLWAIHCQRLTIPALVWRRAFLLVAVLGIMQSIWHLGATYQWARYLQIFRQELQHSSGIVPFERSALAQLDTPRYRSSRTMNWYWTMPLMSIILAQDGQVHAIIENPVQFKTRWEPFDPHVPEQLPQLSRYGITYNIHANRR